MRTPNSATRAGNLASVRSLLFGVFLSFAAFVGGSTEVMAQQGCLQPPGDINDDNITNIVDVQCGILIALFELSPPGALQPECLKVPILKADLNCDDIRSVGDVQVAISYALGQTLNPAIDGDGNQCPDACELFVPVCADGLCTDGAENCATCPQDCGACTGDCCSPNPTPGCSDPLVTSNTCTMDPSCCTSQWDADCVAIAEAIGACAGDCCTPNATASCNDPIVASCVCAIDATCCSTIWDAGCVALAESSCGVDCPVVSDCCSEGEVGGCTVPACEDCVCAVDSFCCDTMFDAICVGIAESECAFEQAITASLSGSQHSPPVSSTGTGSATFTLDGDQLSYVITYQNLVGTEIMAHIHNAPPGDNGPIVIPLPTGSPKIGTATLTPLLMAELLAGNLYINVHSDLFPNGELRGNIAVSTVDGPCFCSQPCCDAHDAPGCEDPSCESCVCGIDAFCCAVSWDNLCVDTARQDCAGACQCGTGDCCVDNNTPGCADFDCESCVCASDAFCCDVTWDEICVFQAVNDCGAVCECTLQDCCTAGTAAGCDNPACESCVCAADTFCCGTAWDSLCAEAAAEECNDVCLCAADACCSPHAAVGCALPSCETCVCGADPFCCSNAWDELCVAAATTSCNLACGCAVLPGTETCCGTHTSTGCVDLDCQSCVCGSDSFCCTTSWDALCVASAGAECESTCGCGAPADCCANHGSTGCNNDACEDCVCADDAFCCESAWDGLCADAAATACNGVCLCDDGSCCFAHAAPGCDAPECMDCVCGADSFCCDASWDELCVAAGGTTCNDACQCAPTPGAEACCSSHTSPGCVDVACQQCVCGQDSFCCSTGWDGICVTIAADTCDASCNCSPTLGDCCSPHGSPSCNDSTCSACVCDLDSSCCATAWDSSCTSLAGMACEAACGCGGANCCQPQVTPGCQNHNCEMCVCGLDDFCCDVVWDELCVGAAGVECSASCACP